MPFWPCLVYMAIGKFLRYTTMTAALLWIFPGGM
jgi:membrane protein YqaA with SNARE-associated domain